MTYQVGEDRAISGWAVDLVLSSNRHDCLNKVKSAPDVGASNGDMATELVR